MGHLEEMKNDVVKLYDALSPIMEVSTGSDMLNFGYWDESTSHPVDAQQQLCRMIGDMAEISSADLIADIGSGILGPAKNLEFTISFSSNLFGKC